MSVVIGMHTTHPIRSNSFEFEEKAIVLKAMRPGAGAAGAAGAAPALPASQPQLPPVAAVAAVAAVEPSPAPTVSTVSAVSAVSAVPAIPAIPASLLGTSFSMPWVQREFTTHQAEGREDGDDAKLGMSLKETSYH